MCIQRNPLLSYIGHIEEIMFCFSARKTYLVHLILLAGPFNGLPQQIISLYLTLHPASSPVTPAPCNVPFHYIYESSLWSYTFPPAWQLHIQHLLSSVSTIPTLHMFKLSQPWLFNIVSKTPTWAVPLLYSFLILSILATPSKKKP